MFYAMDDIWSILWKKGSNPTKLIMNLKKFQKVSLKKQTKIIKWKLFLSCKKLSAKRTFVSMIVIYEWK